MTNSRSQVPVVRGRSDAWASYRHGYSREPHGNAELRSMIGIVVECDLPRHVAFGHPSRLTGQPQRGIGHDAFPCAPVGLDRRDLATFSDARATGPRHEPLAVEQHRHDPPAKSVDEQ